MNWQFKGISSNFFPCLCRSSQSNNLKKTVIDMNTHYLELKMFLQALTYHPESIMNKG